MLPILGSLISAGTSLLGGKMASDATAKANAQNQANFQQQLRSVEAQRDQDFERQQIFAKSGIQWRAQDALQAGIHPLYALGANIPTYSGSVSTVGAPSIAADTSMGSAVASMGQDIGRALNSTRTTDQRQEAFNTSVQALTLQKMGLENTLLASQIKRLQVNSNPPFPSAQVGTSPAASSSAPEPYLLGGMKINPDPQTSDMNKITNRIGDEGILPSMLGAYVAWRDYQHTMGGRPMVMPQTVNEQGRNILKWLDENIKVVPGTFDEIRANYVPNFMKAPQYRN